MAITRNMPKRKRSEHYVNNKEFLAALIRYREDVEITYIKKFGEPPDKAGRASSWDTKPVIPRYIGDCFLKIANHLSFKPNFVNYMFKEDMISDGCSVKSRKNYTLNHLIERIKIYNEENFNYDIITIQLKDK